MIKGYLLIAVLLVTLAQLNSGVDSDWRPTVHNYTHPGRRLQEALPRSKTLRPIRIHFQNATSDISENMMNQFYNKVVPAVKHWFSSAISVYSLIDPIVIPSSMRNCNQAPIPSSHYSLGVSNTDFIIYVFDVSSDSLTHYGSGPCLKETGGRYNMLAGSYRINYNTYFKLSLSEQIMSTIHYLIHAMVFDKSIFKNFVKPDGSLYNSETELTISKSYPKRGKSVSLVVLPTVVAQVQKIFGCSSAVGAELEEGGDLGIYGQHWDSKVVKEDIMVAEPSPNSIVSGLTLALFQDSGWYTVNWDYAQPITWGANQGCSWLTDKCITTGILQQGMCNENTYVGCDTYNVAPAYCNITRKSNGFYPSYYLYLSDPNLIGGSMYADYCPALTSYYSRDCRDPLTMANDTFGEVVGPESRCLTSTLLQDAYYFSGELRTVCHKVKSCESDYAVLEIAGNLANCPFAGGDITVPGFNGVLKCPKSNILCIPAPCRYSCYARGICKSGLCMCDSGYGGIDCQFMCADNCKACDSETTCKACYSTATLADGVCTCPVDSTWDANQKICMPGSIIGCDVSCKGCASTTTCADCWPLATLANGFCNCESGYEFNSTVMTCTPIICPKECNDCLASNVCSRCYDTQILINGQCLCRSGKAFNLETKTCEIKGCSSNCRSCATVSTCSACYSIAILTADGNCTCPKGTIYRETTKICDFTTCPPSCNGCATAKTCSACYSTATLINGQCVCPDGTGFELISKTCKANGITGCDPLCSECTSTTACKTCYSTAVLTSEGKCACPSNSTIDFVSKSCIQGCTSGCKTCSGVGDFRCLSCFPGYYLLLSTCVHTCPTGYGPTISGCTPINLSIYNAVFQQWNNIYYSSTSSIPLFLGSTSQFMPNPEADDPILVYSRGLYYTGSSLSLLPPNNKVSSRVSLSPSHVVEMWIRPDDSTQAQTLLQKHADESLIEFSIANSKLKLTSAFFNITSLSWISVKTDGPNSNSKQWQWISYSIIYEPRSQGSIVNLFVNSAKESKTYSNLIFFDLDSVIYKDSFSIGSKYSQSGYTLGYKGFIAKVIISNQAYTPAYSNSQCIGDFCLANCDFSQYADSTGSCGNCMASCSYSCCQAQSCILNADPKCLTPTSFTTCGTCISGATVVAGKCVCMKNSYFDTASNSCVCNSNSTLINGYCTTCGNYYTKNEIKAYFSEDFKSVIIEFARAAKRGLASDCSEIFHQVGLTKLGKDPICVWQGYSQIQVFLGLQWSLGEEELAINPFSVQARGSDCNLSIEDLKPIVKYLYVKPSPISIITAPNVFSFKCNKNDLIISGDSSIGSNLQYSWSVTSNPSNEVLTNYILSIKNSKFKIPISILTVSAIKIFLTVKNQLGQSDTASYSITIKNEYALDVFIDSGRNSSIFASQSMSYKALVNSLCANSTSLRLDWSFISSSLDSFNPSPILANSKTYILNIDKYQLKSGNWYLFYFFATDGESIGWSYLNITVKHSNLILILNRGSGTASSDIDLYMNASESYDPDDINAPLVYSWTCIENNTQCLDSSGLKLLGEETKSSLIVPSTKLRVGSEYEFTLEISKDTRVKRKSVWITIVQPSGSSLLIPADDFRFNYQYAGFIIAKIETSKRPNFIWTQISGPSLTQISGPAKSYIKFAANSMQEGTSYSFTLTMSFENSLALITSVPWITNNGPICDGVDISQNADLTYTLMALKCIDGDDQDYPLFYMYGTIINNKTYYLSTKTLSSNFKLDIHRGIWQLFVKVCDSMWTCTSYSEVITVESRRILSDATLKEQYLASVINPDMIPSSIIMYSTNSLDSQTLSRMYADLISFLSSQDSIDEVVFDTCIGCLSSMIRERYMISSFLDQVFEILNKTLMANTDMVTDSQIELIIDMLTPYYNVITDLKQLINLFHYLARSWMNNAAPGDVKEYSNGTYFYNIRNIGEDLLNTTYTFGNQTTKILGSKSFKNETVYDMCVAVFPNTGKYSETIIDISFYNSGSYQNYSLDWIFPRPIEIFDYNLLEISTVFTQIPSESWTCYQLDSGIWKSGKCRIIWIKNNTVSFSIDSAGTFKISLNNNIVSPPPKNDPKSSSEGGVNDTPKIAVGIILFFGAVWSITFGLLDKTNTQEINRLSILEGWLLTSLCIPKRLGVRIIIVLHLETVLLSELAGIGIMYCRNNPTSGGNGNFIDYVSDYSPEDLINMVGGLILGQLISLILWGLRLCKWSIWFIILYSFVVVVLGCASVIATILMASKYSSEIQTYWFLGFLGAILLDFFAFQILFSIIRHCIGKRSPLKPQDIPDISIADNSQVHPCTPENEQITGEYREIVIIAAANF